MPAEHPTMGEPKRIQRKRTKGWRMPEGAVYVGRPGRHGNPYQLLNEEGWPLIVGRDQATAYCVGERLTWQKAHQRLVDLFREWRSHPERFPAEPAPPPLDDLRGRDLACWCPLDQPCHADVLLDLANRPPMGEDGRHG